LVETPRIADADAPLLAAEGKTLLGLAAASIRHGLTHDAPMAGPRGLAPELGATRATFVTLALAGELRGCVGTIFARRALAEDVIDNAFAAAFRDHRFAPLGESEWSATSVSISLLGALRAIPADRRDAVLARVTPGHDGLVLTQGRRRGVFLPQVWDKLPRPGDFIDALLRKAGLDVESWPRGLEAQIFQVHETESQPLERALEGWG
jgi:hypothetical protein